MKGVRAFAPVLLAAAWCGGCGTFVATPCDAVGHRGSVVTPQEYRACATATLAAVDALRPPVAAFVAGDQASRPDALARYAELQRLLERSGVRREFANVIYSPGRIVERWPDHRLLEFNTNVWWAGFYYHVALETGPDIPSSYNEEYFDKGSTSHEEARRAYDDIW